MKTQLIFFDIDDTLCRLGTIDKNNLSTLKKLHKKTEIKLAIATGRGSVMLPEDIQQLITDQVVDAVICTNGQYNMAEGQLISHYPLNRKAAGELAKICQHFNLTYQQLSENHIAWSQTVPRYDFIAQQFATCCVIDPDYYREHDIYQFSVFMTEEEEMAHQEYAAEFKKLGFHFTRWQKGGADLLPDGTSKARGIDDVCAYFNIDLAHTMAFGDGLNDMEMLQHVNIGIAMGDGWPQLKTVANHVTGTIEENGISNALKHFGILTS